MKITAVEKIITPAAGCHLAGMGRGIISIAVHDELCLKGCLLDDGTKKILIFSLDLLGLDAPFIEDVKRSVEKSAGIPYGNILLSCTHTHSGPHTRSLEGIELDTSYLESLKEKILEAAAEAVTAAPVDCDGFHYSAKCDENINSRVIHADNSCSYLPVDKELFPLADNIRDRELAMLYFFSKHDGMPYLTIVNYAAHPLASQSPGISGHSISADYPGVIRRKVEAQLGGKCIFISGACGDLHPCGMENGFDRMERMGNAIAEIVVKHSFCALRSDDKYKIADFLETMTVPCRVKFDDERCIEAPLPAYNGAGETVAEIQLAAAGDVALVGVPGELLAEPGLEIKWHSPFRKTLICYNSTGYLSYIPHANAFLQGGYEAKTSHLETLGAFKIVTAAVNGLHELKGKMEK